MERTSPNYNDPQFTNPENNSGWDKYDKGIDKALDTVNTAANIGRKIAFIFMGLFFLLIGGALLIWGITNYSGRQKEMAGFEKTTGTVVSMREVPETDNSGVTYAPVVDFKDQNGVTHKHEANFSSDPPAYDINEKVEILYNKQDPDDAFINSFWGKWGGTLTIFIFSMIAVPIGIWMLVSAFKRSKPSSKQNYSTGQPPSVSIG